jgi:hypothetical protein
MCATSANAGNSDKAGTQCRDIAVLVGLTTAHPGFVS